MKGHQFEIPATFEMVVWFKDDRHGRIGKASVVLPVGKYPTKENIDGAINRAVEQLKEMGLELCGPHEFGAAYLMEETGQRLAIPGPDKWSEPYSS